jgi:putative transcriptional regulator
MLQERADTVKGGFQILQGGQEYDAEMIRRLRENLHISQAVFAAYLNASISTVQKWENGDKKPSGAAARLLSVIERKGLEVLA